MSGVIVYFKKSMFSWSGRIFWSVSRQLHLRQCGNTYLKHRQGGENLATYLVAKCSINNINNRKKLGISLFHYIYFLQVGNIRAIVGNDRESSRYRSRKAFHFLGRTFQRRAVCEANACARWVVLEYIEQFIALISQLVATAMYLHRRRKVDVWVRNPRLPIFSIEIRSIRRSKLFRCHLNKRICKHSAPATNIHKAHMALEWVGAVKQPIMTHKN